MKKKKNPKKLGLAHRLLLSATYLVASAAIASSPTLAFTLASSVAEFQLSNFSHEPDTTSTFTEIDSFTTASSPGGAVNTSANAFASFEDTSSALSSSFSLASGEGRNYLGEVQTEALVLGTFLIKEAETLSFDFASSLDLETSIQNSQSESATAAGDISLLLLDSTDSSNGTTLDFFFLSGNLSTPGDTNDFLNSDNSDNITLTNYSQMTSFGGETELASASVQGSFERFFNSQTELTLIEVQTTNTSVVAQPVSIPESSFSLGSLILSAALIFRRKRKFFFKLKVEFPRSQ